MPIWAPLFLFVYSGSNLRTESRRPFGTNLPSRNLCSLRIPIRVHSRSAFVCGTDGAASERPETFRPATGINFEFCRADFPYIILGLMMVFPLNRHIFLSGTL
jgi:hypothetical protein